MSPDDAEFETEAPAVPKSRPKASGFTPITETQHVKLVGASVSGSSSAEQPKTELQDLLEHKPAEVLISEEHRAALFTQIRAEMAAFVPDLATDKGRKAVAAHAFKITKTKTALDEAGKALNAGLRQQIDKVDEIRRKAREELDGLAVQARLPLTNWEAAETLRENKAREILTLIAEAMKAFPGESAAELEERLAAVRAVAIDPAIFTDSSDAATEKRDEAISHLAYLLNAAQEREAAAAENARLQQQAIAQQAEIDRLAQVERDAQAAKEARQAEDARKTAEAEQASQRAADAAEQAAEAARVEERRIAQAAADETERLHKAELAAVEERAQASLFARIEAEQAAKAAEQTEAQRRAIRTAVRNAIVALGVEKEKAGEITLAILDGKIPHITISYETEN